MLEISPEKVRIRFPEIVFIDVRDTHEYAEGVLHNALAIPLNLLESKIESSIPDKQTHVICYCVSGKRSLLAANKLQSMGYSHVRSIRGGLQAWISAGLPVEYNDNLSETERHRYKRHLSLPEVGLEGQKALKKAKVLIIGVGGLGSPVAYYLAAAGVGTLGLVDFDTVDESNLQRQILYSVTQVGFPKTAAAKEKLHALNPFVRINAYEKKLNEKNAEQFFTEYDIMIDGSDNFPTRYLINDICLKLCKPFVYGSIYRFEGQVSTFIPKKGPCYRCLYPNAPEGILAPNCSKAGVLGVLPGIIGTLQATEAIKMILKKGKLFVGRLVCFDALAGSFKEFQVKPNPGCTCKERKNA